MTAAYWADLVVLVLAAVGFSYGVVTFIATRMPLYSKMICGAVGCEMLGRLSGVVRVLCGLPAGGFQLSLLSLVGVFLFILTANAGLMDGLADDGSPEFSRYRLLSAVAPAGIFVLDVPIYLSDDLMSTKVCYLCISLVIAAASYYNLKHAIFPDVEFGVIRSVRGYNYCALAFAFLHMLELVARSYDSFALVVATGVAVGACSACILPALKRGIDQWEI